MADFQTPYALAQQYAYQGQHLPAHVVAAHLQQQAAVMQQMQQPVDVAVGASAHRHHHQSPQRALNFNSTTPQRAMTGSRAAGNTPASPGCGNNNSGAPSPLRQLDFGGGLPPLTPAAQLELVEEAIAESDDLAAFCCTARGRDLAIAALQAGTAGALQLKAALIPEFVNVCRSEMGTHVLRTLVDKLSAAEIKRVVAALAAAPANETLNLATTSQHTRKLLEALIDHRDCDSVAVLESTLVGNASYLLVLQQGCIALMHLVKISATRRSQIVQTVKTITPAVARDPYGNYVLQTLLEHADEADVVELVKGLKGAVGSLATNKFASNVLEKIVKGPLQSARRLVVAELLFHAEQTLRTAVHDKFGNFVVQAALATAISVAEHRRMCDRIRPLIGDSPFAARIEQRMKQKRSMTTGATSSGHCSVSRGNSPTSPAASQMQPPQQRITSV
jgi:protein-tyrosine-phosphatase